MKEVQTPNQKRVLNKMDLQVVNLLTSSTPKMRMKSFSRKLRRIRNGLVRNSGVCSVRSPKYPVV
jgi:hypothetical protein